MANLTKPSRSKHKYVVGIDFGHGETSAAICELEWDKSASHQLAEVKDIDIDRAARKKVIPSAICRVNGKLYIGDEAFEHTTDNDGIRICFKQRPHSLDGEAEMLMCDYMKAVYNRILENDDRLSPDNHIVYIARPSGWTDSEAKELYWQIAVQAGIPLADLTSESRAAIFYAKGPNIGFAKEISRGGLVFDLGSSTLDFTHLSDNESAIDFGYDLGASKIDDVIYHRMILKSDGVQEFINSYPGYTDSLRFKARKFKENAYGRDAESRSRDQFTLGAILMEDSPVCDKYENVLVTLKTANLHELNRTIEEEIGYQQKLKDALNDFKENHIKGRQVNGVFLTGGASRMNFIRPLVAEVFELPIEKVKYDNDNPSLTISRGIALLGATDALTKVLVDRLKENLRERISDTRMFAKLVDELAKKISDEAWNVVESTCNTWIKYGPGTDRDTLNGKIEQSLKQFQANRLNSVVNEAFQSFLRGEKETIRNEMNEVIRRYAPDREVSISSDVKIGNQEAITATLNKMSDMVKDISTSMFDIISDIFWNLLGFFVVPYLISKIKSVFTSDESKRRDNAKAILDKRLEIRYNVRNSISDSLNNNQSFKAQVPQTLKAFFDEVIDSNLQKVIIPIE